MEAKKQIDIIKEECQKNGLDIRAVFRRADVPESTIENWTRKEPKPITNIEKIRATLNLMIQEKRLPYHSHMEGFSPDNIELIDRASAVQTATPTQRRRS